MTRNILLAWCLVAFTSLALADSPYAGEEQRAIKALSAADVQGLQDGAGLGYVLGASAQCFERPQCFLGYTDPAIYGITFSDTVTIEFGPLLGEALTAGEVDAVIWNTTAPQIEVDGFAVLEDDQGLFPAQNIAPIIVTDVLDAYGDQLATDINELSAMITTDDPVSQKPMPISPSFSGEFSASSSP